MSLDQVASSMFVLGKASSRSRSRSRRASVSRAPSSLPQLSSQATEGRNSQFFNITVEDRERLGGMEYRALKLLLKIILGWWPRERVHVQRTDCCFRLLLWTAMLWRHLFASLDPQCTNKVHRLLGFPRTGQNLVVSLVGCGPNFAGGHETDHVSAGPFTPRRQWSTIWASRSRQTPCCLLRMQPGRCWP